MGSHSHIACFLKLKQDSDRENQHFGTTNPPFTILIIVITGLFISWFDIASTGSSVTRAFTLYKLCWVYGLQQGHWILFLPFGYRNPKAESLALDPSPSLSLFADLALTLHLSRCFTDHFLTTPPCRLLHFASALHQQ